MQKNVIAFAALAMFTLLGWSWLMRKFYPEPAPGSKPAPSASAPSAPSTSSGSDSGISPVAPAAAAAKPAAAKPASSRTSGFEQKVTLKSKDVEAVFSTTGARILSWKLLPYTEHKDRPEPVELVPVSSTSSLYAALEMPGVDLASQAWTIESKSADKVTFATRLAGTAVMVRKSFGLDPAHPIAHMKLEFENTGGQDLKLAKSSLLWDANLGRRDDSQTGASMLAGVVQLEKSIERESADDEDQAFSYSNPKWAALKNHYFVAAFLPRPGQFAGAEIRRHKNNTLGVALNTPEFTLHAGEKKPFELRLYAGPQVYETLKGLGDNLQAVVQFQFYRLFDWLNPLCVGMLKVLRWFHAVTGNWGLAIILLTLLVRAALFYPSQKSMVSMRKMQTSMKAMQPRLDSLKKTYKDDPAKLNSEMMRLYKEYGVNPLGGCLPMLAQIPIFFALYGTLMAAFELRGAHFMWKWTDLSGPDPTHLFAIFMGATMFLQQKMTPTSASMSDEQVQMQKMMMYIFPVMFTFMSIMFKWPTGLLLYWSVSNVAGILQQWYVNKTVT